MTLNIVVVRFVDREVQGGDAVAAVRAFNCVVVNTGGGQSFAVELVEVILFFADRSANSVVQRFVDYES